MCHERLFLCSFIFLLTLSNCSVTAKGKPTVSYRIDSLTLCDIPQDKFDKTTQAIFNQKKVIKNKKDLYYMNITITRTTAPVIFNLRTYRISDKTKQPYLEIENLSCKNPVIRSIMKSLNVKFEKNCSIKEGTYIVKDLNINQISNGELEINFAGRYSVDLEMRTKLGMLVCTSTVLVVDKM